MIRARNIGALCAILIWILLAFVIGSPTDASAGGFSYPQPFAGHVSTNTIIPTSTVAANQAMCYTVHTAHAPISSLSVAYPGYAVTGTWLTEVGVPSYVVKGWVEYPIGGPTTLGTTYPLLFGGSASGTVPSSVNLWSDFLTLNIPDGSNYRIWSSVPTASTIPVFASASGANNTALYTDEGCNITASGVATTPGTFTDNFTRRRRFGPVDIIGPRLGLALNDFGDSIQAQTCSACTGVVDASHDRGDVGKMIGPVIDYANVAIGGDQLSTWLMSFRRQRMDIFSHGNETTDCSGINEFNNRAFTAAQALAIKAIFQALMSGQPYLACDLLPRSTGAWTAVDQSDQTVATYSGQIDIFNTTEQSSARYIARRAAVQGSVAQKWIANGTALYATFDGLHCTIACQALIATASQATVQSYVLQPAINPTIAFPNIALTPTSATFSGGKMTGGTETDGAFAAPPVVPMTIAFNFTTTAAGSANSTKMVQGGPFVYLNVAVGGFLNFKSQTGANATGTHTVNSGSTHCAVIVGTALGNYEYLDGQLDAFAPGPGSISQVAQSLIVTPQTGTISNLSVWNIALPISAGCTGYTGSEWGLMSLYLLSTNGNGTLGPVMKQ